MAAFPVVTARPRRVESPHRAPGPRMSLTSGLASPQDRPGEVRGKPQQSHRARNRREWPATIVVARFPRTPSLPQRVTEVKSCKQINSPSSRLCSTRASDTRSRGLRPRASRCSLGVSLSRATTQQAPTCSRLRRAVTPPKGSDEPLTSAETSLMPLWASPFDGMTASCLHRPVPRAELHPRMDLLAATLSAAP